MTLLLVNDDGIDSPGLAALEDAFGVEHEVWVVAPDGERSGMSHYITLKAPIRVRRVGERRLACSGSPADCVLVTMLGAVPVKPGLVISGINIGPNLGTDLIYSGTAAAARQAVMMGIPAIAVSVDFGPPPAPFARIADFLRMNLDLFLRLSGPGHFVNVNAPCTRAEFSGVKVTKPCRRVYNDHLVGFTAPDASTYYFVKGEEIRIEEATGSDWEAVRQGSVSVTPVSIDPSIDGSVGYVEAEFRLG